MGKLNSAIKKISSLPGYKLIISILVVGLALLLIGKYLQTEKKAETTKEPEMLTEQEKKLAGILSKTEGAGEVEVIIHTKDKTCSVIVLATGADDPAVNIGLRQTVRTFLQTENANIKIIKKQSN